MNFSFKVVELDENMNLDRVLDHINNKIIAGQIALYNLCGNSDHEDFYLPNVTTEEIFDKDIKNVLDVFSGVHGVFGSHIVFSAEKKDIVIDGTGAASKPLLKKKAELEALGYDTMMVMIWVSPYTSLERNASRDRALAPSIVVKTWAGVNSNIGTYKQAFGDNFVLINNDPEGKLEYDPAVAREKFFKTVKGSGKVYTPDEKAKRDKEITDLNANIAQLIKTTPEFTSLEDAKTKVNNFLK